MEQKIIPVQVLDDAWQRGAREMLQALGIPYAQPLDTTRGVSLARLRIIRELLDQIRLRDAWHDAMFGNVPVTISVSDEQDKLRQGNAPAACYGDGDKQADCLFTEDNTTETSEA